MKWISWLAKLCAGAMIMTMVSLYAAWTAVQMVANQVLEHYQLSTGVQKIEFSDFLAEFGKGLNIMKQPAKGEKQATRDVQTGSPKAGGSVSGSGSGQAGSESQASGTGDTSARPEDSQSGTADRGPAGAAGVQGASAQADKTDAVPVWSQSSSGQASSGSAQNKEQKKTVFTTEALQSIKDKMSAEDKMKLFTMVSTKLPPEELQNISRLMEDGITQDKLNQMEAIVKKYLTEEEFNQLTDILSKYN